MLQLGGLPLIEQPKSSLRQFVLQLFRDEFFAAVFSGVATALAYYAVHLAWAGSPPSWLLFALLPLVGPVTEKPSLLFPYLVEASARYQKGHAKGIGNFLRVTFATLKERQFLRVLRADILYHDSTYSVMLLLCIWVVAPQSAWLVMALSCVSFAVAVLIAGWLEIQSVNLWFSWLLKRLRDRGVPVEHYGELRYLARRIDDVNDVHAQLRGEFNLEPVEKADHADWSVSGIELPRYNEWEGYLQCRQSQEGLKLHLVYFRTRIVLPGAESVAGMIYIEKIKVAFWLDTLTKECVLATLGTHWRHAAPSDVVITKLYEYTRSYSREANSVSFALDTLHGSDAQHSLVEVKFWLSALQQAVDAHFAVSFLLQVMPTTQPRSVTPKMLEELLTRFMRV